MRNMPAPNSGSGLKTSTAERDLLFSVASENRERSFRRRTMLVVSAKQFHRRHARIRQVFRQPDSRRCRRRDARRRIFLPACSGTARIAPRGTSARTPSPISARLDATRVHQAAAGSRGDFAQADHGEAALERYLLAVSQHYDAVLIQPIVERRRIPDLSARRRDRLFRARKYPPFVVGDGVRSIARSPDRAQRGAAGARPLAELAATAIAGAFARRRPARRRTLGDSGPDELERRGQRWCSRPRAPRPRSRWRGRPSQALGLRVAAVDLFTDIGGRSGRDAGHRSEFQSIDPVAGGIRIAAT